MVPDVMGPLERYRTPHDLPVNLPVFPLAEALLLPRTRLPLTIFEPRNLAMVDAAMAGPRIIGMIQPVAADPGDGAPPAIQAVGCAGRITAYSETDDGRILIVLTGIARFKVVAENPAIAQYREVEADFTPFAGDLTAGLGEAEVDRQVLLDTLRSYLEARRLVADWDEVEAASTEALVNALSALSPYPAEDKQALLEAADLKSRAEMLIALTEMAMARAEGPHKSRLQ